jgi:hypothetical protein
MSFSERSIDELTKDDIDQLVKDQVIEDSSIEFKREIELDPGGRVKDGSRNDVAREIVAFANSDGGTLIIGIEESDDDPKRAIAVKPVTNCHDLAERLRRAAYEIIEPKLPMFHSRAIEIRYGAGVIVFSVPHSRRAPHRVEPLRDCFRRIGSESRKMTMREIQELTLAVASEADRLNARFVELNHGYDALVPGIRQQMSGEGILPLQQFKFIAVPINPLWIRPVAGRSDLAPVSVGVDYTVQGQRIRVNDPWSGSSRPARPIVRGERRSKTSSTAALVDEIHADGSVVLSILRLTIEINLGLVLNQVATLLVTIDKMRNAAGSGDAEYAIEMSLEIKKTPILRLGSEAFLDEDCYFESGIVRFPRYSYGTKAERSLLMAEIAQDIVHSAGSRQDLTLDAEVYGPGA